jgi:hypothetical protein
MAKAESLIFDHSSCQKHEEDNANDTSAPKCMQMNSRMQNGVLSQLFRRA